MNKLPDYETFMSMCKRNEFVGGECRSELANGLYVLVELLNESVVYPSYGQDYIKFSFCNSAGFPIFTTSYVLSEAGYYEGIKELVRMSHEYLNALYDFNRVNS